MKNADAVMQPLRSHPLHPLFAPSPSPFSRLRSSFRFLLLSTSLHSTVNFAGTTQLEMKRLLFIFIFVFALLFPLPAIYLVPFPLAPRLGTSTRLPALRHTEDIHFSRWMTTSRVFFSCFSLLLRWTARLYPGPSPSDFVSSSPFRLTHDFRRYS